VTSQDTGTLYEKPACLSDPRLGDGAWLQERQGLRQQLRQLADAPRFVAWPMPAADLRHHSPDAHKNSPHRLPIGTAKF
jgi:hypothetical protein